MYPVSGYFLDKIRSDYLRTFGRIVIDYTDPFLDQSITVAASEQANVSYPAQTADGVAEPFAKIASLDGSWILDGTFPLAPSPEEAETYQMGWWGSQLADVNGYFATPYPTLTVTFFSRPITQLKVVGDARRGEYPVDFVIKLYGNGDLLKYTESVTGNTQVSWSKTLTSPVTEVVKMTLEISRWSHPGRQVKILEFFTSVQEVYEGDDILLIHLLEEREVSQGSLPIGNISANEIDIQLNNETRKFDAGNTQSPLYQLLKPNRRIRAWLGVATSGFIQCTANEQANVSYPEQTFDDIAEPFAKIASLDGSWVLDGTYALAPNAREAKTYQMGWWGSQLAGVDGSFTSPYPTLTTTFLPRSVSKLKVVGDSKRGEYPVDFVIRLYDGNGILLYTETVTANTQINWTKDITPVDQVTKAVLEISKWSHAGRQAKILEFFTATPGAIGDAPEDLNIEWVPLGTFWSGDWSAPEDDVYAQTTGRDRLELLQNTTYSASLVEVGKTLYDLALAVLQDAGLKPEEYRIDPELQQYTVPYAYFEPMSHREALRLIAEACLGQVYADRDGVVRVEGPSYLKADPVAKTYFVQGAAFPANVEVIDAYGIGADDFFRKDNPVKWSEVANYVEVETQPLRPDVLQEVYRSNDPVGVPAGGQVSLTVYYNETPCIEAEAVLEGATNTTISSASYYAWGVDITLTNSGAFAENVTVVVKAKPLKVLNKEKVVAKDDTSITDNGLIRYTFPANPLVQTLSTAQTIANKLLASFKDPRRDVGVEWRGNPALLLGDVVCVPDYQESGKDVRGYFWVTRQELEFTGTLQAKLTGRRAVS